MVELCNFSSLFLPKKHLFYVTFYHLGPNEKDVYPERQHCCNILLANYFFQCGLQWKRTQNTLRELLALESIQCALWDKVLCTECVQWWPVMTLKELDLKVYRAIIIIIIKTPDFMTEHSANFDWSLRCIGWAVHFCLEHFLTIGLILRFFSYNFHSCRWHTSASWSLFCV